MRGHGDPWVVPQVEEVASGPPPHARDVGDSAALASVMPCDNSREKPAQNHAGSNAASDITRRATRDTRDPPQTYHPRSFPRPAGTSPPARFAPMIQRDHRERSRDDHRDPDPPKKNESRPSRARPRARRRCRSRALRRSSPELATTATGCSARSAPSAMWMPIVAPALGLTQ